MQIWTKPPDLNNLWSANTPENPLVAQARIREQMGARIKLWHDDVREPPDDSWLWARDNADAMVVLGAFDVDVLSMDHDLGGSDISLDALRKMKDRDYLKIDSEETGVDLAEYIGWNDLYPAEIVIHSMNVVGAGRILGALQRWATCSERNCLIRIEPFSR
jgi:hypothetical protein